MLAIIIPYYKVSFFEVTLESLAHQTDKRFKIYIGDDASLEDCTSLVRQYEEQFDFIYHRFETNLGGISLTQHWERCIALSEDEEWLMILGDDDVLGSNVVEEFYKVKNNCSGNIIRFATIVINDQGVEKSLVFEHPILEKASEAFFRKLSDTTRSSLSEYIFRRSVYDKYNFTNFPLAWYSDDMAWINFSEGRPIYSINTAVVYFRFSELNISGKSDNIEQKDAAKYLFYRTIVKNNLNTFTKIQASVLLTTYEILLRNRNLLNFKSVFNTGYKHLREGNINFFFVFLKRQLYKTIQNKK